MYAAGTLDLPADYDPREGSAPLEYYIEDEAAIEEHICWALADAFQLHASYASAAQPQGQVGEEEPALEEESDEEDGLASLREADAVELPLTPTTLSVTAGGRYVAIAGPNGARNPAQVFLLEMQRTGFAQIGVFHLPSSLPPVGLCFLDPQDESSAAVVVGSSNTCVGIDFLNGRNSGEERFLEVEASQRISAVAVSLAVDRLVIISNCIEVFSLRDHQGPQRLWMQQLLEHSVPHTLFFTSDGKYVALVPRGRGALSAQYFPLVDDEPSLDLVIAHPPFLAESEIAVDCESMESAMVIANAEGRIMCCSTESGAVPPEILWSSNFQCSHIKPGDEGAEVHPWQVHSDEWQRADEDDDETEYDVDSDIDFETESAEATSWAAGPSRPKLRVALAVGGTHIVAIARGCRIAVYEAEEDSSSEMRCVAQCAIADSAECDPRGSSSRRQRADSV
eukprot:CAMPEP_0178406826 /NCGR_PEP_ID=MMETSP0689_2-20121128/19110_1 /TAXON_ID=160604 /ORGANISM="Amphidinium massartii, Strain CS-259" /LENGTH=451 /DNA_ID=CAMNT_0020027875 /DNA_START=23 /DNA_END=1375 /DNA_ORIENTATION=-